MMGNDMMESEKVIMIGAPYNFKQYKKFVVFDEDSLFCFKKGMKIRDSTV